MGRRMLKMDSLRLKNRPSVWRYVVVTSSFHELLQGSSGGGHQKSSRARFPQNQKIMAATELLLLFLSELRLAVPCAALPCNASARCHAGARDRSASLVLGLGRGGRRARARAVTAILHLLLPPLLRTTQQQRKGVRLDFRPSLLHATPEPHVRSFLRCQFLFSCRPLSLILSFSHSFILSFFRPSLRSFVDCVRSPCTASFVSFCFVGVLMLLDLRGLCGGVR